MRITTDHKVLVLKYAVEAIAALLGILLVIIGWGTGQPLSAVLVGIGGSLLAASMVSCMAARFYSRAGRAVEIVSHWGLIDIFRTRQAMNQRCDETFVPMRLKLDIIGWGLRSFRNSVKWKELEQKIIDGLQIRILAPHYDSPYTAQQDKDEDQQTGHTADTIVKLRTAVAQLKSSLENRNPKGSIELRLYRFRPQDFYFRQDHFVYTGPYLFGVDSQQTISFEYAGPSRGFDLFTGHFENVWAAAAKS